MVVGNGLIGKRFQAEYNGNDNYIILASGVSNSKSTRQEDYERELQLVSKYVNEYPGRALVYFSTCSIYDPGETASMYIRHKLAVEKIIASSHSPYHIFRISNVAGSTGNPNTILNFLFNCIENQIHFNLWKHAYRNLVDIDDVYRIIHTILDQKLFINQIVNIANPVNYAVSRIVSEIEQFCGKKGNYTLIDSGSNFEIDIALIRTILDSLNIAFPENYLSILLHKYYSRHA
ncbi:MAG: NAD-dependent epimerase/dehydratase family protein [Bacteroidetes bacterium]|nr:NAD-dependent epimerase/dehydratase family protein [Bacteroidota bacterium]